MNLASRPLLRGALILLGVVVASVFGGALIGAAVGELNGTAVSDPASLAGDGGVSSATLGTTAPSTPEAAGATGTGGPSKTARLRVLSASFEPATSASGRQRRRARVTVRLRARAGNDELILARPRLVSGGEELANDTNAAEAAAGLLDPIPAGQSVTGELRFETAEALSDRLQTSRRATLRLGDESLPLRLATP